MPRPGELDLLAEAAIRSLGGVPNFMKEPGYRHTICASINEDIVHGIPGERVVAAGDIISIDSGAEVGGWNGDAAITVVLPDPDRPDRVAELSELSDVTEQSLWCGIAALASVSHLGEVGGAIEDYIDSRGTYGILEDYTGHGIGRSMHEEPPVFNYRVRDRGPARAPRPRRGDRADGDARRDRDVRAQGRLDRRDLGWHRIRALGALHRRAR